MNEFKLHKIEIAVALNLLLLFGCTYTQTYKPQFNGAQDKTLTSIKTAYGFEKITFTAKKQSGNGGDHSSLIVKFINGKSIPVDSTKMFDIEKQLGTQIKGIMKNPKEFETYIILLDSVTKNKGELSDVTHENYTGHEFNCSDL